MNIVVTTGDCNGIGIEVLLKALDVTRHHAFRARCRLSIVKQYVTKCFL
jgi:4-hydroxy-L-threonine phosphate dehydrogenase PdxA